MAIDYIDLMKSLQAFTFLENSLPLIYLLNIYGCGEFSALDSLYLFHLPRKNCASFDGLGMESTSLVNNKKKKNIEKKSSFHYMGGVQFQNSSGFFQIGAS